MGQLGQRLPPESDGTVEGGSSSNSPADRRPLVAWGCISHPVVEQYLGHTSLTSDVEMIQHAGVTVNTDIFSA